MLTIDAKKEKARWARIKRVYGLTKEQYDELDPGFCKICLRPWSNTVRPCVDHDHHSGHVRGVICLYCNHRILGRHRDSGVIRRMADYLDEPSRQWVVPVKKKRKKKLGTRPKRTKH